MSRYLRVTLFLLAAAVPAERAQYPGQIYVYSILTIESGVVSGECGAIDFDPTPWLYRGIISDCNFPISGSAAEGHFAGRLLEHQPRLPSRRHRAAAARARGIRGPTRYGLL